MGKQAYSIKEVLDKLDISRATLYNRIDKNKQQLDRHISSKNGKKYISSIGIEILRANEGINDVDNMDNVNDSINNENRSGGEVIEILKKDNEFLKNQILEKDSHIHTLTKLIENSQILLRESQQKVLLLETKKKENFFKRLFIKKSDLSNN